MRYCEGCSWVHCSKANVTAKQNAIFLFCFCSLPSRLSPIFSPNPSFSLSLTRHLDMAFIVFVYVCVGGGRLRPVKMISLILSLVTRKVGAKNGRSSRKNTWRPASRTWLISHVTRVSVKPTAVRHYSLGCWTITKPNILLWNQSSPCILCVRAETRARLKQVCKSFTSEYRLSLTWHTKLFLLASVQQCCYKDIKIHNWY